MLRLRRVRLIAAIALLLIATAASGSKRRSVRAPEWIGSTPEGWLAAYAHVLTSIDGPASSTADLQPLKAMIRDASVVGLGDPTHGTHESLTLKLRLIDFMVREMDFDVVAIEAPFATIERLDAYVQTGTGDARAILRDLYHIAYVFWDIEEFAAVIDWMRAYNASRGDRPAIHIAGTDIFDDVTSMNKVLEYLRSVDASAAATAETLYACARANQRDTACRNTIAPIRADMVARESQLIAASSATAYRDALQYALLVEQGRSQFFRDIPMSANVLWLREHRSTTRKIIYWAHNAHVMTFASSVNGHPAGRLLREALGDGYFSLGMLTGTASFTWWRITGPLMWSAETGSYSQVTDEYYESLFRRRSAPALLIPMPEVLPSWFPALARWSWAGSAPHEDPYTTGRIAQQFDAIVYVDVTTPSHPTPR